MMTHTKLLERICMSKSQEAELKLGDIVERDGKDYRIVAIEKSGVTLKPKRGRSRKVSLKEMEKAIC